MKRPSHMRSAILCSSSCPPCGGTLRVWNPATVFHPIDLKYRNVSSGGNMVMSLKGGSPGSDAEIRERARAYGPERTTLLTPG